MISAPVGSDHDQGVALGQEQEWHLMAPTGVAPRRGQQEHVVVDQSPPQTSPGQPIQTAVKPRQTTHLAIPHRGSPSNVI